MPLQIRRGTNQERIDHGAPFAAGELVYVTDTQKLYIGDGTTNGGVQVTGFDAEDAVDAVGAAFLAGTHQNISFTYGTTQDNANRIDATVSISTLLGNLNLNNYNITGNGNVFIHGQIAADSFVGSIFPDNSSLGGRALVDGIEASINLNGTVKDDVIPAAFGPDLGSAGIPFNNVYVGGAVTIGAATINAVSSHINLPTGSTVNGAVIPTLKIGGTAAVMDLHGSVFGDDSTIIVDGTNGSVTATGGIYGDVYSDNIYSSDGGLGCAIHARDGESITTNYYKGTRDAKVSFTPGDLVGSISVKGWNGSTYAFGGAMFAQFEATANLAADLPNSIVGLLAGTNSSAFVTATLNSKGTWSAPTLQTGVYATTPSDTRPTGVKGMIIFNDTSGKFQGYTGSAWVDLS